MTTDHLHHGWGHDPCAHGVSLGLERGKASRRLIPGIADAKLEQQDAWLALVRRWLAQDREAAHAFNNFRTREKERAQERP